MTENEGSGYAMTNADDKAEVALGRAEALRIVILHMMRAISAGRTGEEAYRVASEGIEADVASYKGLPTLQHKALVMELTMLAATFRGPVSD